MASRYAGGIAIVMTCHDPHGDTKSDHLLQYGSSVVDLALEGKCTDFLFVPDGLGEQFEHVCNDALHSLRIPLHR